MVPRENGRRPFERIEPLNKQYQIYKEIKLTEAMHGDLLQVSIYRRYRNADWRSLTHQPTGALNNSSCSVCMNYLQKSTLLKGLHSKYLPKSQELS